MPALHGGVSFAATPLRETRPNRTFVLVVVVGLLLGSAVASLSAVRASPSKSIDATLPVLALAPTPRSTPASAPSPLPIPDAGPSIGSVLSTLDLSSNQLYSGSKVLGVQGNFGPEVPVYDPVNGNIYIRGNTANDISVVNASTFTNVANIFAPVANQVNLVTPSIAVDNLTGYLYATNSASSNVSVIDPGTETVTGSITVGGEPLGLTFDWKNGDLYVADYESDNVAVISAGSSSLSTTIPVGTHPVAVAFDPTSDRVFVTNYGSANVSVIDPTSNTVAATVIVGTDPIALTMDTVDGEVDVLDSNGAASSVSVFSAASPPATATSVSVANYANSFAYDPLTDRLFVAGAADALTVVQQPGNTVAKTLSIGPESTESATAFDPKNGYIVVTAYDGGPSGTGNVTVIDGSSYRSVANVSTGDLPYGVTVDPGTGDAYVVNFGTSVLETNVTVLGESTGLPVASIPLWVAPTGVAYDSAQGAVYAVDNAGNDLYEVNTSTGYVVHVETGGPNPTSTSIQAPVVYDGANGDLYAADASEPYVDVYGPAHTFLEAIPVGEWPDALAYDNASDLLFAADNYNGNVTIIDTSTNTVLATSLTVKDYDILSAVAYDPHNNEVYVADRTGGNVTVWGADNDTKLRSIPVGLSPTSIVFDPGNNTLFVANEGSSNVSVINDTTNSVVQSFTLVGAYLLAYDGALNAVYNAYYFTDDIEAFNASTYATLSGSPLNLGEGGGYYVQGLVYDPANGEMYVDDSTGDALNAVGTPTVPRYPVEFIETGLPQGTSWSVTLNSSEQSSTTPTITFSNELGSLPFTVGTVPGYTANVTSGTVVVTNGAKTVHVGFALDQYGVSFVETGLPTSSLWNVTLNGVENHSTTDTIGFTEVAGTYPFTVGAFLGYAANVTHGSVIVTAESVVVEIGFTPEHSVFPVTFVETGLPVSTPWSVTFHGAENSSTTSTIGFLDPNGTWPFTIGAVTGYTANITAGSIDVHGAPAQQEVTFTAGAAPLSVQLGANPTSIVLGHSTTLTATASGGSPPLSYLYTGLPSGCTTQNSPSWACTPTAKGTFTITVNVTDSLGKSAQSSTSLTVTAATTNTTGNGTGNPSNLGTYEIVGGAAAAIGVALLVVFLVARRRRRPPGAETAGGPAPQNPPP